MSKYRQKLLDPRWQKKRLVILERDNFRCAICSDHEKTLHVHHKRYSSTEPWDIPDYCLVTLCADCHSEETEYLAGEMKYLTEVIRERFSSDEIADLALQVTNSSDPLKWGRQGVDGDPSSWLSKKK